MSSSSPSKSSKTAKTPHSYQSFEDLFNRESISSPTTAPDGGSPTTGSHRRSFSGTSSILFSPFRRRTSANPPTQDHDDDAHQRPGQARDSGTSRVGLTTWDLINLTMGLGGAQLTWTVEMAYGTPYLLELGLTKQGTSLVWMAGPLSGMLIQPLVGALSDSSTSKYRRRCYIALSAVLIIVSTLVVAFAQEIASVLCALGGIGDWDPERVGWEQTVAIWIGVAGFYVLDFSLNGLQATMRALVLDIVPSHQQNQGNAWLGRQTHIANIFGYLCGFFDLGSVPALRWIGGGQFRRLGVIACLVMAITVVVTCVTQEEEKRSIDGEHEEQRGNALKRVVLDIKDSIKTLPIEVRRVCYVQFFAWTAWFPFLFYASTYVAETLYSSIPENEPLPSPDDATRAGSLALLLYALVSLFVGTFLPYLTTLGNMSSLTRHLSFSTKFGRVSRWILSLVTPKNCWTAGLWSYVLGTVGTFFVTGPKGAMAFVAFQGISWAITCWVPFALVMEYIRETEIDPETRPGTFRTEQTTTSPSSPESPSLPSSPALPFRAPAPYRTESSRPATERTRLVHERNPSSSKASSVASRASTIRGGGRGRDETLNNRTRTTSSAASRSQTRSTPRGGTVLGIHNLAIVAPQFLVAIVSALIFKLTDAINRKDSTVWVGGGGGGADEGLRTMTNDVVWVLRFGGLAAIGGAIASRWIIEPRTEHEYKQRVLYGREPLDHHHHTHEDADEDHDRRFVDNPDQRREQNAGLV
ncbi:uncharacterized protein JCM15063_002521 [Sporobolomyces koalae]|uniref:uncharacterized protein n=1 Tax=Sporobolomyces koalae TaxID=500713 RepID=UPI00318253D6